jgi:murein endopeptidase
MPDASPQDTRGFFFLPQSYEGGGYYVYGTPGKGAGQYAHPRMHTFLTMLASRWAAIDTRKFGVGNISLAGGGRFEPHKTHRDGLGVDIRPIRKDGKHIGVSYKSPDYDRAATAKLMALILKTSMARKIYFNDLRIPHVYPAKTHDNHFHIDILAS